MASNARKQRTINNSIVDIDNVVIGPGDAYATWIDIAKHKLWDREFALLQQRREACNLIIVRMIKIFSGNQSHLLDGYNLNVSKMEAPAFRTYRQQLQSQLMDGNSPLIAKYMQSIDTLLTNWKGYHPTKKTINTFQKYFQQTRIWLDGSKMAVMAPHLWLPMMRLIQEVSREAALETFHPQAHRLRNVYESYLTNWIRTTLFI
eukprot:171026_1